MNRYKILKMQKPYLKIYIYLLEIGDAHFRSLTGWKEKKKKQLVTKCFVA